MSEEGAESEEAPGGPSEAAHEGQQTETKTATAEKGTAFTISKVHVRPGKPFPVDSSLTNWANCLTTLPSIPEKSGKYTPMPYTFRLPPAPKPTHVRNVVARSPPFHLLLDHTIAVIWMIFSSEEHDSPLGIAQLQWALAFLKTIFLRSGERPKDVEICIENIEDLLIEEYARLSPEIEKMDRIDESEHYADGAFGSRTVVTKKLPFSKTYADMVAKLGETKVSDVPSITSVQAQEELETIKRAAGVESIEKLDTVSKDKAINILKMWYAEQTGKIKEEVKKLKNIQDQIANVNDGTFHYLDPRDMENILLDED